MLPREACCPKVTVLQLNVEHGGEHWLSHPMMLDGGGIE